MKADWARSQSIHRNMEYFSSDEFVAQLRTQIKSQIVEGQKEAFVFAPPLFYREGCEERHAKAIAIAFNKLKREFPQLNHIRMDEQQRIIVSTKENTGSLRRHLKREPICRP